MAQKPMLRVEVGARALRNEAAISLVGRPPYDYQMLFTPLLCSVTSSRRCGNTEPAVFSYGNSGLSPFVVIESTKERIFFLLLVKRII